MIFPLSEGYYSRESEGENRQHPRLTDGGRTLAVLTTADKGLRIASSFSGSLIRPAALFGWHGIIERRVNRTVMVLSILHDLLTLHGYLWGLCRGKRLCINSQCSHAQENGK